jgi:excinuclease ABC subunit B
VGRAARNVNGRVIMYADAESEAMRRTIFETNRRRRIQETYNKAHGISPRTVEKGIRSVIEATHVAEEADDFYEVRSAAEMTAKERADYAKRLEKEMREAAANLEFERAALLRDRIFELKVR